MYILMLLPLLVTLAGGYMLIKLRGFFVLHPIKTLKVGIRALRKDGVFSSFTLALAGTLGVGNIFGVAMGIILGGAGSVFWLIVSALFSCVLKYSEVLMTASSGENRAMGTPAAIKEAFPRASHFISPLYSALCLCLALVMGASLQARSLSGTIEESLGTSRIIISVLLTLTVLFLTRGGGSKIEKITEKLIPLSSIIYIFSAFFVIFANFSRIPEVICEIFSSAFSPASAAAGVGSFAFILALREGYSRGVMSNEAGVGTSSFAHGRASCVSPAEGGALGIFEVLFDTVFICGITGIAILLGVPDISPFTSGMSLVLTAFSSLGEFAAPILVFCIISFALSSVLCWYYYGDTARGQLFGNKGYGIYTLLFLASVTMGVFLPDGYSVRLTDLVLLFMSCPVLLTLIKSSDRIKMLSELDQYKFKKTGKNLSEKSKAAHRGSKKSDP